MVWKYKAAVERALSRSPVCGLMGPRQAGKSTLAREVAAVAPSHFFDLESPRDQLRLHNPELALSRLEGLVVLDEIQTRPDLFPVLRVLADRPSTPAKFLILGSAAPELNTQSVESLAGGERRRAGNSTSWCFMRADAWAMSLSSLSDRR